MLTLSGAPDCVISWSDFSLLHKIVRKLNSICRKTFFTLFRFSHFNYMLVLYVCLSLWLLNYKQQSLAYSNMCYLLWSYVGYRIVFLFQCNFLVDLPLFAAKY